MERGVAVRLVAAGGAGVREREAEEVLAASYESRTIQESLGKIVDLGSRGSGGSFLL